MFQFSHTPKWEKILPILSIFLSNFIVGCSSEVTNSKKIVNAELQMQYPESKRSVQALGYELYISHAVKIPVPAPEDLGEYIWKKQ